MEQLVCGADSILVIYGNPMQVLLAAHRTVAVFTLEIYVALVKAGVEPTPCLEVTSVSILPDYRLATGDARPPV